MSDQPKPTVRTHPKFNDWVTITQVNHYFQTVDDIHIKKSDIDAFIKNLTACRDESEPFKNREYTIS